MRSNPRNNLETTTQFKDPDYMNGDESLADDCDLFQQYIQNNELTFLPLGKQILKTSEFEDSPLISVFVSVCYPDKAAFSVMIESILNQTYTKWELCLLVGNSYKEANTVFLNEITIKDQRIRVCFSNENRIEQGSGASIVPGIRKLDFNFVSGEYIAFVGQNDTLAQRALYTVVRSINDDVQPDILYTDEDRISFADGKRFSPIFKPDWSPDLLRSYNYIGHLFVVKKTLVKYALKKLDVCDKIHDYDLIFRTTELAEKIMHIPQILYHRQSKPDFMESQWEPQNINLDLRAIESHLKRVGYNGSVSFDNKYEIFRIRYELRYRPVVSIIIPNSEHLVDLKRCIASICQKTTYHNYEIIIAENNSRSKEIFEYYHSISTQSGVQVINKRGSFNYSRINNYAAKIAEGEILIFLNNDTEIISPDWIEQMLQYIQRDDVGCVGARLYYADDTIQHAGVVLGFRGIAGHSFSRLPREESGYMNRSIAVQDLSAVTAACMMISRNLFEAIGGFDVKLRLAFNDIDLCMKVRQRNKLVVYNPLAELYHYESISRGAEDTIRKKIRFRSEVYFFKRRWRLELAAGDPYYNPHLDLELATYRISGK